MKISLINYRKKTLIVLLVLITTFLSVSCRSEDVQNNKDSFPNITETTLTIYANTPPEILKNSDDVIEEMEARLKNNLNVKLDIKSSSKLYDKEKYRPINQKNRIRAIEDLLRSGEPCDAIELPISDLRLIDKSLLEDITDILPVEAPELMKNYDDGMLRSANYEGRIFGVPSILPVSQRYALYVKKEIVEKYNIKNITDFEEYEELLKELSYSNDDVYPGNIYPMKYYMLSNGYVDIGGCFVYKLDDPEMKLIPWEQTEVFKEMISRFKYWSKQNYVVDLERANKEASLEIFDLIYDPEIRKNFDVFILDTDKTIAMESNTKRVIAFKRNSRNINKVLKFLEWTQSNQKNYDLFTYGIKNKHYTLENNKLKRIGGFGDWHRGFLTLVNPKYERDIYESPDKYADWYINNINKNTIYPKHTGFNMSNGLVEKILIRNEAFQTKIVRPSPAELIQSFDIEEFITEQKNNGIDKTLRELQQELDEWYMENR